jgi:hypothetical protein
MSDADTVRDQWRHVDDPHDDWSDRTHLIKEERDESSPVLSVR